MHLSSLQLLLRNAMHECLQRVAEESVLRQAGISRVRDTVQSDRVTPA